MPKECSPQMQQVIYNVYCYYKKQKMDTSSYLHINDVNINTTVSEATGVSKSTVSKIVRVANDMKADLGYVNFSLKASGSVNVKKKRIVIDDYTVGVIRRKAITAENIRQLKFNLGSENLLHCSYEYLRQYLQKLGFTKLSTSRTMKENVNLLSERTRYLKAVKDFRAEGKSLFYLDETKRLAFNEYIDTHNASCEESPSLVIVHMSGTGFINKAQLMLKVKPEFEVNKCFEDFENYDWMKDVVIPNIPSNSVIVVNIPYSETFEAIVEDNKPSPDTATPIIKNWMNRHNIHFKDSASKSDLLELVDNLVAKAEYSFTKILKDRGHEVIHMPEKHADMNPLAVMLHDITDMKKNVHNLVSLISSYPKSKWEETFKHVLENEEEYYKYSSPDDLVNEAKKVQLEVETSCNVSKKDDCQLNKT